MAITKATASAIAPAAKGDLVVGSATNDAAVLAVGSADQVLTVDSSTSTGLKWATVASGGMTVIASGSVGTGTSLSLTSISNAYNDLVLIVQNMTSSAATWLKVRFNGSSAGDYSYRGIYSGGTTQYNSSTSIYFNALANDINTTTSSRNQLIFNVPNYTSTTSYKVGNLTYQANTGLDARPVYGTWSNVNAGIATSAIDRIDLLLDSGTFSAGTYKLYGVK